MEFNPQKQLAGLLEWMAERMAACYGRTAVIGISGGKDSSVTAALAAACYGREHVYGVLMPDGVQPDIDYSQALVEHLQIPHTTINIHDAVTGVVGEMEKAGLTPSRQTLVNLPSRIRMATLYAVAQSLDGGIVINTSNLSEDWVGYCTVYGDSAGAFSPLGMYTTEEVIALGRVLGLPEKFLIKPPSDGLTGLTDEDNLGFTYHAVNQYIRHGVVEPDVKEKIDRKHAASRFKFQTLPVYQNGLPMVIEDETDFYNPEKK
ncbi:MAG: NAD(+) synthase [Oscillospiraceae bacterium]|nr:NAD(+) synthase [Oscillospiraceae bacterium]